MKVFLLISILAIVEAGGPYGRLLQSLRESDTSSAVDLKVRDEKGNPDAIDLFENNIAQALGAGLKEFLKAVDNSKDKVVGNLDGKPGDRGTQRHAEVSAPYVEGETGGNGNKYQTFLQEPQYEMDKRKKEQLILSDLVSRLYQKRNDDLNKLNALVGKIEQEVVKDVPALMKEFDKFKNGIEGNGEDMGKLRGVEVSAPYEEGGTGANSGNGNNFEKAINEVWKEHHSVKDEE